VRDELRGSVARSERGQPTTKYMAEQETGVELGAVGNLQGESDVSLYYAAGRSRELRSRHLKTGRQILFFVFGRIGVEDSWPFGCGFESHHTAFRLWQTSISTTAAEIDRMGGG
jgi:hypothetical protein